MTFVQLHPSKGRVGGLVGLFGPPDELKNLYNDPDVNAQLPQFKVDVAEPGKTDYFFDLKVEGKEPAATPGKRAVTKIRG
jgi:hypothetical protein